MLFSILNWLKLQHFCSHTLLEKLQEKVTTCTFNVILCPSGLLLAGKYQRIIFPQPGGWTDERLNLEEGMSSSELV